MTNHESIVALHTPNPNEGEALLRALDISDHWEKILRKRPHGVIIMPDIEFEAGCKATRQERFDQMVRVRRILGMVSDVLIANWDEKGEMDLGTGTSTIISEANRAEVPVYMMTSQKNFKIVPPKLAEIYDINQTRLAA